LVASSGTGANFDLAAVNAALKEHGVKATGTVPTTGSTPAAVDFKAKVATVGNITKAYANIADESITKLKFAANATGTTVSITKDSAGVVEVTAGKEVTFEDLNKALKDYGITIASNDKDVTKETTVGTIAAVELDVDAGNVAIRVNTQTSADAAITTINDALEKVSSERSKLGAMQNRLEHTIKNLDTSAENLQASEARIRDVDMAKEMMEFTKTNILSQAAQAMLAQANQQPQGVLQLLR
ncbi:MAG TPA: flagellin, partial [Thermoclostridium sp.]|nr:flagellin [Thermoclostridium sp.]